MKHHFKGKRGLLLGALGFHSAVLSSLPALLANDPQISWTFLALATLIIAFTIALYARTFYIIDDQAQEIRIYFIFKVKRIKSSRIRAIVKSDSPQSGLRYAISYSNGLLIKAGKYDEYFINPVNRDAFLAILSQQHARLIGPQRP